MDDWKNFPETKPQRALCWVMIQNEDGYKNYVELATYLGKSFYCVYDSRRLKNVVGYIEIPRPHEMVKNND